MTSTTFQRLLCLAAFLLGTQAIHAQSHSIQVNQAQKGQAMEQNQIHTVIETNNAAVAAGDIEGVLATFEPNGVLVGEPGMIAKGTPALRETFKQFIAINPKITIINHDVIQADDIAIHSSTWKMSGLAPDGSLIEQSGFSVVVLRKQPDGRWLMVIDNPFAGQLLSKN
ncbi:SgcJ/EcaC family oxidoreductase [Kiloniella sp. EL199]|uniref:YybH family protein n=1 Tax=Kiloniella sp. EL199 TaxID=2107581 RepID=UPI000EA235E7|nr:SgcJ/EcaC family oxidoreductase [Kiloniella sp. EL199]